VHFVFNVCFGKSKKVSFSLEQMRVISCYSITMKPTFAINAFHPFPWPRVFNLVCPETKSNLKQLLEKNEDWIYGEKLDGCNMTLFSNGFIASRRKLICQNILEARLLSKKLQGQQKFQKESLDKVHRLQENVVLLEKNFNEIYNFLLPVDVWVYGEFMVNGTPTSPQDLFNYQTRNYMPGDFFCFGMGISTNCKEDQEKLETTFSYLRTCVEKNNTYNIWYMNPQLELQLTNANLKCIQPYEKGKLKEILQDPQLFDSVYNNHVEGYMLHNKKGEMVKWKNRFLNDKSKLNNLVQFIQKNVPDFQMPLYVSSDEKTE
jgi:hypothetical protein